MLDFSDKITLMKNARGVYDLDTTKGCLSGMKQSSGGCYGDCYAARSSKRYGYNFAKTITREFESLKHLELIRDQIMSIDMPFIRIGVSGDPSENWGHTVSVVKLIQGCGKCVVIVTKHWNPLTDNQIKVLSKCDVCFNTSVSALDNPTLLKHRLAQYNRLKLYCKSILRIVSCDFNLSNLSGMCFNETQKELFKNQLIIDTILRVSPNNKYVLSGTINTENAKFLGNSRLVSRHNNKTYFGRCDGCPEMCGLNVN